MQKVHVNLLRLIFQQCEFNSENCGSFLAVFWQFSSSILAVFQQYFSIEKKTEIK